VSAIPLDASVSRLTNIGGSFLGHARWGRSFLEGLLVNVKRGTLHVAKTWPDKPVLAAARLETKLEPALGQRAVYECAGTEIGGQLTEPAHDINGSRTTSLQSEMRMNLRTAGVILAQSSSHHSSTTSPSHIV
jgi:hypothetical protein